MYIIVTENWYTGISRSQHSTSSLALHDSTLLERLLFRVARKWVSGTTINDALCVARNSNKREISAILNFLGEDSTNNKSVERTVNEYILILELINSEEIDGSISVKPTQVGLKIGYDECLRNLRVISKKAASLGKFMWIDIESFQYVESTLSIYLDLFKDNSSTGVALQSYLRRSASDLLHLIENGANVRLVKGAYKQPEENAYQSMTEINSSFSRLTRMLFEDENRKHIFAIATHDPNLIDYAIALSEEFGTDKMQLEFQLLMGIHNELKDTLVKRKFKTCEYIPYGSQWLPYSIRRIRERKRNILLLARSIF